MFAQLPSAPFLLMDEANLDDVPILDLFEATDLFLDAIVGTGFKPPLRGVAAALAKRINSSKTPVVAVDLPSGWDADSRQPDAPGAFRANAVVTFTAPKARPSLRQHDPRRNRRRAHRLARRSHPIDNRPHLGRRIRHHHSQAPRSRQQQGNVRPRPRRRRSARHRRSRRHGLPLRPSRRSRPRHRGHPIIDPAHHRSGCP